MSQDNLEKVKSNIVLEMITVAHDYCLFTESAKGKSKADLLGYYQKVLPLLYIKGALLPQIEPEDLSANTKYVTEEHWQEVFMACEETFGKDDKYWHPDANNDLIKESLADNLADIYQDMKDFVILFQDARLAAKENAVADLFHLFKTHWGIRIPKALSHIHNLLYQELITEEEAIF
ncbi:MAG: DUF5063 domain-containing protein [Bacteroidales bacterium]|nr:DUF5063 domain-containing protein [Bacteroidales bacterium]